MTHWTDSIVGGRMAVDREFNEQVTSSRFDSQEWELVMTATEFGVENADDPEVAHIVADTEKIPQIIPELDNIRSRMGAMDGGGDDSSSGDGIVDFIKDTLEMGGNGRKDEQEKLETAERLTQEYAGVLQDRLEKKSKWNQIRASYPG